MLYRHYRPKTFDDVIGQELIVRVLRKQVADGRVGHAYLLSGPRGTGKTSIARILAKAVNCTGDGSTIPCGRCDFCLSADSNATLDIVEMDAASHRGIDDIRLLREAVHVRPVVGKHKVYIIDEVHMLTTEAFNALLKTLEEPPVHILFILATTDIEKVPATIISRTQTLPFEVLSRPELVRVITRAAQGEGWEIEPGAAEILARAAHGGARDVLTLLERSFGALEGKASISADDVERLLGMPSWDATYGTIKAIVERRPEDALAILVSLGDDARRIRGWGEAVLSTLRSTILLASAPSFRQDGLSVEQRTDLEALIQSTTTAQLLALARTWIDGMEHAARMADPVMGYELLLMQVTTDARSPQAVSPKPKGVATPSVRPPSPTQPRSSSPDVPPVADGKKKGDTATQAGINIEHLDAKEALALSDLVQHWTEVVGHMRNENFSIGGLLAMAIPIEGARGEIIGVLPHRFHAERLHRPAIHEKVLTDLETRTGKRARITWKAEQDLDEGERLRYSEEQERRQKEGSDFLALAQDLMGESAGEPPATVAPGLAIS